VVVRGAAMEMDENEGVVRCAAAMVVLQRK